MSLTCEEITIQALARASEVSNTVPATRTLAYRRIGLRQQQLFAAAAKVNSDYYGACAETNLVAGAADLADIASPVPTPELVSKVCVENPGTSAYVNGDEVNIVQTVDITAALAPRMTLRDLVLQQVGTELAGVTSIMIYYSRLPKAYGPTDAATLTEISSPWDELLVVDLTIYLLRKAPIDAAVRKLAIDSLKVEEAELLSGYLTHVREYGPVQDRFGRSPAAVTRNDE